MRIFLFITLVLLNFKALSEEIILFCKFDTIEYHTNFKVQSSKKLPMEETLYYLDRDKKFLYTMSHEYMLKRNEHTKKLLQSMNYRNGSLHNDKLNGHKDPIIFVTTRIKAPSYIKSHDSTITEIKLNAISGSIQQDTIFDKKGVSSGFTKYGKCKKWDNKFIF